MSRKHFTEEEIEHLKKNPYVLKVSEKVMVVEHGRYVERVKVFRDITELCGKQKLYMETCK